MNLPGCVGLVGERDVPLPDLARDLGGHERLDGRSGRQRVDGVQRDPFHLLLGPGLQDQRLRRGDLADRGARLVRQVDDARVLGVVGDARPVERRVDLDVVAERVLDRLPLEVLVRIAGIGEGVPDGERVERPARVDVRLAEEGMPIRARGLRARLHGPENDERREVPQPPRVMPHLHEMPSSLRLRKPLAEVPHHDRAAPVISRHAAMLGHFDHSFARRQDPQVRVEDAAHLLDGRRRRLRRVAVAHDQLGGDAVDVGAGVLHHPVVALFRRPIALHRDDGVRLDAGGDRQGGEGLDERDATRPCCRSPSASCNAVCAAWAGLSFTRSTLTFVSVAGKVTSRRAILPSQFSARKLPRCGVQMKITSRHERQRLDEDAAAQQVLRLRREIRLLERHLEVRCPRSGCRCRRRSSW